MNSTINYSKIISVDKVLEDKKLPSWLYKAAFELKVGGYLPTGEFFEKLDDEELDNLRYKASTVITPNFKTFHLESKETEDNLKHLALLCFILALGEGEVQVTPNSLSGMLESLLSIITIDSLHREHKVEVIRENYSLFETGRQLVRRK